jgi:8-oxo-dGTP diphosphatase
MRERPQATAARPGPRRATFSVDVVLLTPRGKQLAVLLIRADEARTRERWWVPHDEPRIDESMIDAARRIATEAAQIEPTWLEQVGAFGDGRRHPTETDLSVAYVGVVPQGSSLPTTDESGWFPLADVPTITPRQRVVVDAALETIRLRLDQAPIAFRLLPPTFTLSELQQTYELLLGRRLHKASFRRALQAAWLVEPTDEWRSEGRGRPAQLFRYAPRRRRNQRRGVRFDLLSG